MLTPQILPVLFSDEVKSGGETTRAAGHFTVSVTCGHVNTSARPVQACFMMSSAVISDTETRELHRNSPSFNEKKRGSTTFKVL